jgi:transposase-like protein
VGGWRPATTAWLHYPLTLRNLEEMMAERGVAVDHAAVHRWSLKILPVLAKAFAGREGRGAAVQARRSTPRARPTADMQR